MIYTYLAPPRYYLVLGGISLLAFIFGWFFLSSSLGADADATTHMVWKLPEDAQGQMMEDIQFLKEKGMFGDAEAADIPEDEDENEMPEGWRSLGIVIDANHMKLLIKNEAGEVQTLKEGDLLPDNRQILKINKDSFVVKDPETQAEDEIRLFPMTREEMRTDIIPQEQPTNETEELPKSLPKSSSEKPKLDLKNKLKSIQPDIDDDFDIPPPPPLPPLNRPREPRINPIDDDEMGMIRNPRIPNLDFDDDDDTF